MGKSQTLRSSPGFPGQAIASERAVVAVPGDPLANAAAEANGATVVHGGALSTDAWANVRKHQLLLSTSQAFPTPVPAADAATETPRICPLCKQPLRS